MTSRPSGFTLSIPDEALDEIAARVVDLLKEQGLVVANGAAPEWLSTDEAAAYLGLSKSTVQKLAARREIDPHAPRGGRARFRRAELDCYLESRCA
jgi:excisionase family DNA binding protein